MAESRGSAEDLVRDLVDEGILATGAQLYASQAGQPIVDVAVGADGAGRPVRHDTLFATYCATKPLLSVALARLVDCGEVATTDVLGDILEPPLHSDLAAVELGSILTHSARLDHSERIGRALLSPARQRAVARSTPRSRGKVGDSAYSELLAWTLIGEVIEALAAEPLGEYLRREVRVPLGVQADVLLIMSDTEFEQVEARLGLNCTLVAGSARPLLGELSQRRATDWNPSSGGYASAQGMGRFYEGLLSALRSENDLGIDAHVLGEFTRTRFTSSWDEVLGRPCSYGLGFMTDLAGHEFATACSAQSFGHSGNLGITAGFADPAHDLVVAFHFNALIDPDSSIAYRRRTVCEAIYRNLS